MISFKAYGHKNILATHKNTFEFTKDREVTLNGDCILGVRADFDSKKLTEYLKDKKEVRITISVGELTEEIHCSVNANFSDDNEIVVRRSDFSSKRTLGIHADKACVDFSRELVEKLQNEAEIDVRIS